MKLRCLSLFLFCSIQHKVKPQGGTSAAVPPTNCDCPCVLDDSPANGNSRWTSIADRTWNMPFTRLVEPLRLFHPTWLHTFRRRRGCGYGTGILRRKAYFWWAAPYAINAKTLTTTRKTRIGNNSITTALSELKSCIRCVCVQNTPIRGNNAYANDGTLYRKVSLNTRIREHPAHQTDV